MVSHQEDPLLTFTEAAELIGKSSVDNPQLGRSGLIAAYRDPSGCGALGGQSSKSSMGQQRSPPQLKKSRSDSIACAKTERSGTRTSTR